MKDRLYLSVSAFFMALVSAAFAISYAAIIYTGDLSQFLDRGVGVTLLGATAISIAGAFWLSYKGTILGPQDVPAILLSVAAAQIYTTTQMSPDQAFATIACLVAFTSIAAGVSGVVIGRLRLAYLARFVPYPVLAGFLAATGLLLLQGGLDVVMGAAAPSGLADYFDSDAVLRWAPVLIAAVTVVAGTRKFDGPLVLPLALMAVMAGFYALYAALGFSMDDLREARLLLGPFQEGGFLAGANPNLIFQADWWAIFGAAPTIFAVVAATLLGTTLNATGLELQLQRDLDINKDFKGVGYGNILSGVFGGIPGYHTVGETYLASRLGATNAIAGLSSAFGSALPLFIGAAFLTYLPLGFFATVIAFLGVDLLYTWFWEERRRLGALDYCIVLLIPLIAVSFGFLTAIGFGLILACALFVFDYAKLDIIRLQSDVAKRRSRVERPISEQRILARKGHQAKLVELSGFLFFGSTSSLRERLRQIVRVDPDTRWLILEFHHVSGIDVSTRHILRRAAADMAALNVDLVLTGLTREVFAQDADGAVDLQIYSNLYEAIEEIEESLISEASKREDDPELSISEELSSLFSSPELSAYTAISELNAGDLVLSTDSVSKDIYVLQSGKLRVEVPAAVASAPPVVVAYVRPGTVIGEMATYTGQKRTAAVYAEAPSTLMQIKLSEFGQLEAKHPDIAVTFHKLMASVIARRLQRTTRLLSDFEA